jgi:hypothetical protein
MKFNIQSLVLIIILMTLLAFSMSAQYKVSQSVFSSGGEVTQNENYRIIGTIGQIAVGVSGNDNNHISSGFWYGPLLATDVILQNNSVPNEFRLYQNYPNPFNPNTVISWQLPAKSHVLIKVYDMLGKEVAQLIDEEKPAGTYKIIFNASSLASGIYFYKIQTNSFSNVKKMVLLK